MKVQELYGVAAMNLNYGKKEIQIVGDLVAEISWIKIKVNMFDDDKIKIIQSMPEGDALLVIWIRLIALAGKVNSNGYVYLNENLPYTDEMLSTIFSKPISTIKLALTTFEGFEMIERDIKGIYLNNFSKHQAVDRMAEVKEYERERKRKYREIKKLEESKGGDNKLMSGTSLGDCPPNVPLNVPLDKDIDKDKEINNIEQQVAQIWSRYPVKKGKAFAIKKLPKLIKQHGHEQLIRCIERYELTKSFKDGYKKQGDTFFNGAYVDYLDENYQGEQEDGIENNENISRKPIIPF